MSAKIISVANQKGGVGKTTTSYEIAACLAQEGRRVLLIDFDSQCNLSMYVGADMSKPSIHEVLDPGSPNAATFTQAIQHISWEKDGETLALDFVPSSVVLTKASVEFMDSDDSQLLDIALEEVRNQYDYVIIDNSPLQGPLLNMTYEAADYIIIPTTEEDGAISGIQSIYNGLEKKRYGMRRQTSHAQIIAVILIRYERTVMHESAYNSILQLVSNWEDRPMVKTVSKSIAVSEAKSYKMPMQIYNTRGTAAFDYRDITLALLERMEGRVGNV